MHVPNLHWILADDTDSCNQHIDEFLNRFGESFFSTFFPRSIYEFLCVWMFVGKNSNER